MIKVILLASVAVSGISLFADLIFNDKNSVIAILFNGFKKLLLMRIGWPQKVEETPIQKAAKMRNELLETWVIEYISAGMDPDKAMKLAKNKLDVQVKEQFKDDVEKFGRGLWPV